MPPVLDGDNPAQSPDAPAVDASTSLKPLHIRCEDGSLLEVEKMDLPRQLKHVLREMDLDNTGMVDEKNFEDSLKILRHLRKGLDTDGSGHVTHQEMEDGVSLLTLLMEEKAKNSNEMPYKHLPDQIQDVMREWDADGSGMVGVSELSAAAHAYKKIQQEGRMMKRIIVGLAIVILFLMVSMFVLSYLAVDMAKEMRGSGDGVMEAGGVVVKVRLRDVPGRLADHPRCRQCHLPSEHHVPPPPSGQQRHLRGAEGDAATPVLHAAGFILQRVEAVDLEGQLGALPQGDHQQFSTPEFEVFQVRLGDPLVVRSGAVDLG